MNHNLYGLDSETDEILTEDPNEILDRVIDLAGCYMQRGETVVIYEWSTVDARTLVRPTAGLIVWLLEAVDALAGEQTGMEEPIMRSVYADERMSVIRGEVLEQLRPAAEALIDAVLSHASEWKSADRLVSQHTYRWDGDEDSGSEAWTLVETVDLDSRTTSVYDDPSEVDQ